MAYRSSLDAKMSQSKCIGVWGMPHSQSVHCAWLPGTASMCPIEYVRYWFIEYDSSSSSFLYIVHMHVYNVHVCSTRMWTLPARVTYISYTYLTNIGGTLTEHLVFKGSKTSHFLIKSYFYISLMSPGEGFKTLYFQPLTSYTQHSVHPTVPVLLTKNGPLGTPICCKEVL